MVFGIRVVVSKEKKGKTKKEIKKSNLKNIPETTNNIVISIDCNKQIAKYNKECEHVLGFSKKEAVNKPIFDMLIPDNFSKQWEKIINYSKENNKIDDFKLPLLDNKGKEIWISWSYFPVKNAKGTLVDINLVGSLISPVEDKGESVIEIPKIKKDEETQKLQQNDEFFDEKPVEPPIKQDIKPEKTKNYLELKKMIKKLKKENSELEKKNKNLEKNLDAINNRFENLKKKREKQKKPEKQIDEDHKSFSELISSKKRKKEYENIMKELDDREKYLNNLETSLKNDKIKIDEKANEFKKWREKLESLELEIENRKHEIISKEKFVIDKIESTKDLTVEEKQEEKEVKYHDLLDKIPDSAVVIHRGILKQVNDSFADLIGYNINEILNKSLKKLKLLLLKQ